MSAKLTRPNPAHYLAYCYGKILPAQYRDWVRHDLAGTGARTRNLVRVMIPAALIVAPLWLIPATLGMHLAMSLLLLLPCVYFAHALDKIWRAHRLRQHGLHPDLVHEAERERDADRNREYRRRYGHDQDGHDQDGHDQDGHDQD
jgi:hypothetical protein